MKSYEGAIFPCEGERHWPQHDFPLDPPDIIIFLGRPRKNTKRHPHRDPKKLGKLSKHGSQMSCGIADNVVTTKGPALTSRGDQNQLTRNSVNRK